MYVTKEQIAALDRMTPESGMTWIERPENDDYPLFTLMARTGGTTIAMPLTSDGVQVNRRDPEHVYFGEDPNA